jgi:hypothetical protein
MSQLSPKTQSAYIRGVKKLGDFLGHSPHTATSEDLRRLFDVTLDRKDVVEKLSTVPVPRKLPVVLSREEVNYSMMPALFLNWCKSRT